MEVDDGLEGSETSEVVRSLGEDEPASSAIDNSPWSKVTQPEVLQIDPEIPQEPAKLMLELSQQVV